VDEQAEIADSLSQAIMEPVVKQAMPLIETDSVSVTLDRATSRRFVNSLRLTLSVRAVNKGSMAIAGSGIVMRVAAGDALVAPLDSPLGVIDSKSSGTGTAVFDLPAATTEATVRTTIEGKSSELPIRFSR
jgi:hypothetical protein